MLRICQENRIALYAYLRIVNGALVVKPSSQLLTLDEVGKHATTPIADHVVACGKQSEPVVTAADRSFKSQLQPALEDAADVERQNRW